MDNKLVIGLIGFGCVGGGLYEVLNKSSLIDAKIKYIVVKDPNKARSIPQENFSYDVDAIINDDEVNLVVELINDSSEAFEMVQKALKKGKNVVSANKKMIAEHLSELIDLANENNVSFLYEGSVAGAIPIIRNLEEYYNNDSLTSVEGIVNGTTNYILTQANHGVAYEQALSEAQDLGFAELDPTLDVEGYDSKYKLVILIKHAFGLTVPEKQLFTNGIQKLDKQTVEYANEKGYHIKLFSKAAKIGDKVVGFVAPHFIQQDHFAYDVNNEFNAVVVEGLFADKQLFVGKGAGSYPTASAVLSDVSALTFDYKYEYHKSKEESQFEFTNDVILNVFVGSENRELVKDFPFKSVNDFYMGENYTYKTGKVVLSDLINQKDLLHKSFSLVVLPDELAINDISISEEVNSEEIELI